LGQGADGAGGKVMDISRVRITIGPVLGALLSVLFLSVGQAGQASGPQGALKRFEFTKLLMGVQARIVVYAPSEKEATDAGMLAFDRIARLEDVMSDYRPQSELMRVCDDGKMGGVAVRISEDLRDVLAASEGAWRQSGGAFDPTVGPLVTLWRQARKDGKLPPTEAIAEAKARVGWKHVHLDAGARTVSFDVPGMRLDLGGIGKGFAVEAAGAVLRGRGVASYLVALAGDIAVGDAPPGERGWEIAVRTGAAELGGEPTLELERSAVSTSGDAEQFVEIEGVRYAHIIDPRTGLGVTRRVGATVIGPLASAAEVDALATAVCVLGADKGMELLRGLPGVGGMIMERERDGAPMTRRRTPGFGAAPGDDNRFDPANEPPAGFVAMFNGRDLSGWQGLAADPVQRQKLSAEDLAKAQSAADERMRAHWHAVDGVLVFDGKGDSLQSARNYGDFEMYVDWKIEKAGDSGIYVRGSPQVQIWDNPLGSGGLYNNQKNPANPLVVADRPVGEWNRSHIIMKGDRVTVWLNDRLVTDNTVLENYWEREKPIYPTGPIELQNHGNTLYFKNIFVRDLSVPGAAAGAGQADHDTRMAWWRDARFGMFIHWGLYAIPAGVWDGKPVGGIGEWIMNSAKVPVAEYEKLAQRFNPAKFDARVWAKTAKDAGIKYVVITSKHHDGFALFDSKVSDYDVMGTPFKRDILKELSEACRAEGIRFCTYHSIMDWHHPDYLPRRPWDPRPDVKPDFNRYVGYLKAQLKEIVTGYQPAILWFDGEWEDTWTHERGKDLYD
jgi:thiamine biosynthesis lipoprotein ApbE